MVILATGIGTLVGMRAAEGGACRWVDADELHEPLAHRHVTHDHWRKFELRAARKRPGSQPNVEPLEFSLSHSPLRWQTTNEHFPVEEDGCVLIPQTPGIGVTLNQNTIEKYRFAP